MEKFEKLSGVAAPFDMINIDTDKILPKQFLKTIKSTGLGAYFFTEMRYLENGSDNPEFILNKSAYRNSQIIVAGDNFGCGSSREHAPWALLDFGIKCIISTSFADIFFNNCFKNGILPIVVSKEELDQLMSDAENGSNSILDVDLESQQIGRPNGEKISFEVDDFRKHCLLNGLDEIGLTMEKQSKIDTFKKQHQYNQPWI